MQAGTKRQTISRKSLIYKVRFHLQKGPNYLKWQVRAPDGSVRYYDPKEFSLVMINCKLKNRVKTAQKIHDGADKSVCAWIECEQINVYQEVLSTNTLKGTLSYNPKSHVHWILIYDDYADVMNADNESLLFIYAVGGKLFI